MKHKYDYNISDIKIIPRKIRAKFKNTKKYNLFSNEKINTEKKSSSKWKKLKSFKNGIQFNKKPKYKIMDSTINSDILQNTTVDKYIPKTDVYHIQSD